MSGSRSRQRCRSNAGSTVDSFGYLDWSKCRRRTSQPKSCGLMFKVFDRLQGSTRNPLLVPTSRGNGGRKKRTTCPYDARMQRADRYSYNDCQENASKQNRQLTLFHPSLVVHLQARRLSQTLRPQHPNPSRQSLALNHPAEDCSNDDKPACRSNWLF